MADLKEMSVKISVDTSDIVEATEKMKVLNEEMQKFIDLQKKSSCMPVPSLVSVNTNCIGKEINPMNVTKPPNQPARIYSENKLLYMDVQK